MEGIGRIGKVLSSLGGRELYVSYLAEGVSKTLMCEFAPS